MMAVSNGLPMDYQHPWSHEDQRSIHDFEWVLGMIDQGRTTEWIEDALRLRIESLRVDITRREAHMAREQQRRAS